jgi:hypothetical protein
MKNIGQTAELRPFPLDTGHMIFLEAFSMFYLTDELYERVFQQAASFVATLLKACITDLFSSYCVGTLLSRMYKPVRREEKVMFSSA